MALYKQYAEIKAIGVMPMSNFGGIEILDIIHGVDDYAVACFNFGTGRQQIRKHKICCAESGRQYIKKQGRRYYFDQIMKI